VKILSEAVPHFFFIFLAIMIAWIHGFVPSVYTLQSIYYLFAMILILLGLGWMTSSTNLFVSDVSKVVSHKWLDGGKAYELQENSFDVVNELFLYSIN
jgi:lipopolysaccharide transport system permease protein/teichoic acid transport system permease protein